MTHPRKIRFGIQLATATTGAEWAELARKAEDLGYSTLFMPDHFGDQLAPVPALMAAADATTELRVGALVFDLKDNRVVSTNGLPPALIDEAAKLVQSAQGHSKTDTWREGPPDFQKRGSAPPNQPSAAATRSCTA